jgi:hypothetical protein
MTFKRILRLAILWFVVTSLGVSSVFAGTPAVSPTTDPFDGYPIWYQDATGIRVQPCLYKNGAPDPFCILLADPGFIPGNPLVLGSNFPVEFFYAVADAAPIPTPGCPASGIAPASAKWRGAIEGSFLTGVDQPGQQSTFTRTKVVANGLCPNTTYNFIHPYGTDTFTTNNAGQIVANKKGGTIDIGCLAAPCDFSVPLTSRVMGGFLQLSPAAPGTAGYLGDAVTLGTIIGSPTGTHFFEITDPTTGAVIAGPTNQFTVSGKIAGPLMASPSAIAFAGQTQFTTSAPAIPVTITNVDSASISVTGTSFTGANAADFTVFSNSCTTPLARDATCVISVNFRPSLIGAEKATLAVTHDGPFGSPLNVDLTGTGTAPGAAPIVSLSAASLTFPPTRVRTLSTAQTITVTVAGNAPLGATVTVMNAPPDPVTGLPPFGVDQFKISADSCTGNFVPVGSTCQVSMQYAPTLAAAATAILNFADNATNTPQTVTLTGTGTGGIAAVSSTTLSVGGVTTAYPDWYQDENGVQVQPCLYNTANTAPDPLCVLIPDGPPADSPAFTTALPLAYTGFTNWPIEFFYYVADSDKMSLPGCPPVSTAGPNVTYRAAMEGSMAFTNPKSDPTMFTRTKIVVAPGGLCPSTTYAFVTPYGTDLITTDSAGGVVANKKGATVDIGCLGTCTGANTALPLSSRVFGGFLKWDPAVPPAAPAGYLGDAGFVGGVGVGTPHAVIGSPYIPPGETAPANFLRIADAATGAVLNGCTSAANVVGPCQVNLFTVSGKLAQSVHTSQVLEPGPVSFPQTTLGTASVAQTVTLTNGDAVNSVLIGAAAVLTAPAGAASLDFSKGAADTCSNATLAPGATCTIDVVFNPTTAARLLAGVLVVPHSGATDLDSPAEVPLSGIGLPTNQPPVAVDDSANVAAGSQANQINVLANDSDPDGNVPLTVGSFTQPLNGTVVLEPTQNISYAPNAGFSGTDTFTYQAMDSLGAASNVATVTVTVGALAATTTSIGAPAVTYPANGVVTITVSSGAGTPTGTVSLSVDGAAPLSGALDAAGTATFTLAGLAAGSHSLSASYAAQSNFAASSASGSLTVNPAATTTAINAPAVIFPSNGVVTVTVSSAAGVPGGNVSLSVDGGAPITQALAGGSSTFTLASPAAGTHTLSASYAAQGNFAASSSAGSLVVSSATTATSITAPPVTFPANALVTVIVTSPAGTPTGNVTLSVDGALPITQPLAGGQTTFTVFSPSVGNHTLAAAFAAQGNFAASGAAGTLLVNPAVVNEIITATASASRNKQLTQASWTVNGTTSIRTSHTMTVTLTRTGALIGTATTDTKGQWKLSNGKSSIVPVPGDTITVTSSLGKVQTFSVTVK